MSRWARSGLSLLAAVVAVLTMAGGAFAYWTGAGSGTASGGTSTGPLITLSPGSPTAALYPGGSTSVVLTITNANTVDVRVSSLVLDTSQGTSGFTVDSAHSGCGLGTLSLSAQTTGWTVPAHATVDGTLSVTLTNALSMTSAAASACQGATFTVYLVAGA